VSLVIADVDGTLLTKDKTLTPRAEAAINALRNDGIALAITSGRPPRGMSMLTEALALRTPIAGFNGGMFVNPDMTVIEQHILPGDITRRAIELILDQGMDAWLYRGNEWLVRDAAAPHVAREQWTVKFAPTVIDGFASVADGVIKVVGVSDDFDLVARCEKRARDALGSAVSAVRSQPYYLDVTHPAANKGTVVATLSQLLSIPSLEIATIGDMPNDVLMFRKSGLSIAMGNASAEVKAQAMFVTASNEEDGFAEAMERFVLPPALEPQRVAP